MQYRWKFPEVPDVKTVSRLESEIGVSRIVAELLVLRGLTEPVNARRYIELELSFALHDPFLMNGMEKACQRIVEARDRGELVMIHGDYDVDGVSSLALLTRFFGSLGISSSSYIPTRLSDGYGLSSKAIAEASRRGISLIVTADCGIRAVDEVREAADAGIDIIVTDHHEPGEFLPEACTILNPKQEDCSYPDKDLAGVGVAWKLCQGIYKYTEGECENPEIFLDLVCLGSIADVAPVRGENRAIIRFGLKQIDEGKIPGIMAIKKTAGSRFGPMTYRSVAFILAPRLNAAGRLGEAERALRLLCTDDEDEAFDHARWLEEENKRRRKIDAKVTEEVRNCLARSFDRRRDFAVVLSSREWHPGVIGIVASRIAEEYYRPVILISVTEDGVGKGSARSIPDFSMFGALSRCSRHLREFGGHNYAAGLVVDERDIGKFAREFQQIAREELVGRDLNPELTFDLEIDLSSVSLDLLSGLKGLEPFGPGNTDPLFCIRNVEVLDTPRLLGRNQSTLKFAVGDGGQRVDVIGFGMGDYLERIHKGSVVDLAVHLEEDNWRGNSKVGMKLEDIRLKSGSYS
jgi:single-stranded-DNA-specific exonuclease